MLCVFTLLVVYIMFENTSLYAPFGLVCLLWFSPWNILVDMYSSPQQVGNRRTATDSGCYITLREKDPSSKKDCD